MLSCPPAPAMVLSQQNEAAAATGAEATRRVEVQEAKQRAEAAEARCAQLEKEADSLALDVATLQASCCCCCLAVLLLPLNCAESAPTHASPCSPQTKLGQGEVNRSSVRVLHFKLNPETQYHREKADSTAAELRAENSALKRRLEELAEDLDESRRKLTASGGGNSNSKGPAAADAAAAHSGGLQRHGCDVLACLLFGDACLAVARPHCSYERAGSQGG